MPNGSDQLDKFKEAARALECDDDEARFDERVKKLVKHKAAEAVTWRVVPVKAGHGFIARRNPNSGLDESPSFSTPQDVSVWLAAKGLTQSESDEDLWS